MIWQDIVISIATIVFSIALVPQIIEGYTQKKALITLWASGPTFIGLFAMTYAFFTLHLYYSTIMDFINAILWLIIFIQGIIYKN